MKCTDKEWMHCRVEKMGCFGCHYNKNKIYIHYGAKHFDENLFQEIKNIPFVKPEGGLWASDVNSKDSWKDWVEANDYCLNKYKDDNYFKFRLKENARVLRLENKKDLEDLPRNLVPTLPTFYEWLDFEKLSKYYDAVEVVIKNLYWDLYGWDCDSILIMNKDVVVEV